MCFKNIGQGITTKTASLPIIFKLPPQGEIKLLHSFRFYFLHLLNSFDEPNSYQGIYILFPRSSFLLKYIGFMFSSSTL